MFSQTFKELNLFLRPIANFQFVHAVKGVFVCLFFVSV